MPGPTGRYGESAVGPWLEGLLPDRPETLRQWRRQFGIAADLSPFARLRHVGEDVAGAAQFRPTGTARIRAVGVRLADGTARPCDRRHARARPGGPAGDSTGGEH